MTKRERDAVVELLRCAADQHPGGIGLNGMSTAAVHVGASKRIDKAAWSIRNRISEANVQCGENEGAYRAVLLEAAQRVEEGTWP